MSERDNIANGDGNLEALRRYERECEKNERANDIRFEELKSMCSDSISYLNAIVEENPDFADELREFIGDMI